MCDPLERLDLVTLALNSHITTNSEIAAFPLDGVSY